MLPLEHIDSADLPDGGQLRLMRRGGDFTILFGRNELMSSRVRGSEEALASLVCEKLRGERPVMLIGGLGMGFTLGAALAGLPKSAKIIVAELLPKIVEWARGPLAHLFGNALADPRLSVEVVDVHAMIVAAAPAGFDAILLDVDNGPDGLIHAANDRLYGTAGLLAARAALKPGGVLAIWSAYPDKAFAGRLQKAGFAVEEVKLRATGGRKGAHHVIWMATRPVNAGSRS